MLPEHFPTLKEGTLRTDSYQNIYTFKLCVPNTHKLPLSPAFLAVRFLAKARFSRAKVMTHFRPQSRATETNIERNGVKSVSQQFPALLGCT